MSGRRQVISKALSRCKRLFARCFGTRLSRVAREQRWHPVTLKRLFSRWESRMAGGLIRHESSLGESLALAPSDVVDVVRDALNREKREGAPGATVYVNFPLQVAKRASRPGYIACTSCTCVSPWKYRCYGGNRQSTVWNIFRANVSPWKETLLLRRVQLTMQSTLYC